MFAEPWDAISSDPPRLFGRDLALVEAPRLGWTAPPILVGLVGGALAVNTGALTVGGMVAFVALLSCLVSMLNWGLSLVFSVP